MKIANITKPVLLCAMLIALLGASFTFMLGQTEGTAQAAIDSHSLSEESEEIEATISLTIPNGYKTGQWPTVPSTYTEYFDESYTWLLMEGVPNVTMTDDKAQISFTTAISIPAVTVYYGVYDPDAVPPWPHFVNMKQEELEGVSQNHQVELSDLKITPEMQTKGGGVIVYRIEMQNIRPPLTSSISHYFIIGEYSEKRIYDSRFEFYNGQIVPTVSEGPFVDQVSENSAIISWETDRPVESGTVKVEGVEDASIQGHNLTHFEIKVMDLVPGTTYNYTVEVSDAVTTTSTPQYFFRTPVTDTTQFSFAVMGDSRSNYGGGERDFNGVNAFTMRTLTNDAFFKNVDFIVHTADMINGYTPNVLNFEMQLESFKDSVEGVGHYIPIYEMMGNHEALIKQYLNGQFNTFYLDKEGDESTEAILANEFVNPTNGPAPDNRAANAPDGKSLPPYSENVYYFDYGNSRFVTMNNNYWWSSRPEQYGGNLEGYVLDDQMAWLTQVFSDTKTNSDIEHLFLFAQEPMFPNNGHIGDAMWYNDGDSVYPCVPQLPGADCLDLDRSYIIERRDEIWRAFVGTGKAVAANFGDEHNYSRTLITHDRHTDTFEYPAWQIISGGAGAPISFKLETGLPWSDNVEKFSSQFHYTLFRVHGQQVMLDVYSIDGALIESVELTSPANDPPTTVTVSSLSSTGPSELAWQWMMAGLPLSILAGILIIRRRHKRRS